MPSAFKKEVYGDFVDYKAPFKLGNGWYDSNKTTLPNRRIEDSLYFAAVSTNMLYWWMVQNRPEMNDYIQYLNTKGHFNSLAIQQVINQMY